MQHLSNFTSMYNTRHRLYPRDANGTKLSTSTIIIIVVVCGCVVLLVLALFLWRLLVRGCRRNKPLPLPPVQPLAHRREQQQVSFAERHSSKSHSHFLRPTASDASLLPVGSEYSSRNNSYNLDDCATSESNSPLPSPLSDKATLPLPNPAFFGTSAHSSVISSDTSSVSDIPAAIQISQSYSVFFSETSSSLSDTTSTTQPLGTSTSRSPARSGTSSPKTRLSSRPISLSSVGTSRTNHTLRSQRSIIRGAPHGPHSNVQIILPAPLAPDLYPHENSPVQTSSQGNYISGSDRFGQSGYVDQWVSVGTSSMNRVDMSESSASRRVSSRPPPRSTSQGSVSSSAARRTPRRTQSQVPLSRDGSPMRYPPPMPAMPPMPSARNGHRAQTLSNERDNERGRSTSISDPTMPLKVSQQSHKLRKSPSRSRSRGGTRKPDMGSQS